MSNAAVESRHPGGDGTMRTHARRGAAVVALVLVGVALAVRWLRVGGGEAYEIVGPTMGTSYSVKVAADLSEVERTRARAVVEQSLKRVSALMSTYDSTSELSRFNRHASTEPVSVSAELVDVLVMAREVSERSLGAFDVTVGPLVEAWGFGPGSGLDGPVQPRPSDSTLSALRERIGYDKIVIDTVGRAIAKMHPDTRIDLSAIAKGYGVEVVARALEGLGLTAFLVEVGGELRAVGTSRNGRPWRVGIERPDDAPGVWGTLALADEGIATSGDYRDYYDDGGVRYAHILDPRTGRPLVVRGGSVTVVHRNAALADAWATALTVLGPEAGLVVARREGVAALFLYPVDGAIQSSSTPAFAGRL
jgi:thiamine biosynthesis lipoprotein